MTSKLASAQCTRVSPSQQREHLPAFDQRSSSAASDRISFGVSDNELDDSLSLLSELSGSVTDPALWPSSASCKTSYNCVIEIGFS